MDILNIIFINPDGEGEKNLAAKVYPNADGTVRVEADKPELVEYFRLAINQLAASYPWLLALHKSTSNEGEQGSIQCSAKRVTYNDPAYWDEIGRILLQQSKDHPINGKQYFGITGDISSLINSAK